MIPHIIPNVNLFLTFSSSLPQVFLPLLNVFSTSFPPLLTSSLPLRRRHLLSYYQPLSQLFSINFTMTNRDCLHLLTNFSHLFLKFSPHFLLLHLHLISMSTHVLPPQPYLFPTSSLCLHLLFPFFHPHVFFTLPQVFPNSSRPLSHVLRTSSPTLSLLFPMSSRSLPSIFFTSSSPLCCVFSTFSPHFRPYFYVFATYS